VVRFLLVPALLALSGCLPEVRVGEKEGIPPIGGSTEVSTGGLVCGEPLPAGAQAATTRKVPGGCELSFIEDLQVLDEPDYEQISSLTSFSGLLEAVELQLTEFRFIDADTQQPLDTATQIVSATLAINGQPVADKGTLTSLPQTLRLTGAALDPVKEAISQRKAVSLRVNAVVVLPDQPPPPASLRFEYQAQPTLVLGGPL